MSAHTKIGSYNDKGRTNSKTDLEKYINKAYDYEDPYATRAHLSIKLCCKLKYRQKNPDEPPENMGSTEKELFDKQSSSKYFKIEEFTKREKEAIKKMAKTGLTATIDKPFIDYDVSINGDPIDNAVLNMSLGDFLFDMSESANSDMRMF